MNARGLQWYPFQAGKANQKNATGLPLPFPVLTRTHLRSSIEIDGGMPTLCRVVRFLQDLQFCAITDVINARGQAKSQGTLQTANWTDIS